VCLDTLAAAHAEAGNFEPAVKWVKRAIDLAPPAAHESLRERLALYEKEKPYRLKQDEK
jgi:hypothetical protein